MRIVFYVSDKPREHDLARAFVAGATLHGHTAFIRRNTDVTTKADLACMVGVKSKRLWSIMQEAGVATMLFDKGYSRHKRGGCWEYWRISLNEHNPTQTTLLSHSYPSDRFDALNFKVEPWRGQGSHIVLAGSSEKCHSFLNLPEPTAYARNVVRNIKKLTTLPIVYRPKPSWKNAVEIPKTIYSKAKEPLTTVLADCHALVTNCSNICFEAALMGVPSIMLGQGVMRPISSTELTEIESPLLGDRQPLFNSLAYHQWTLVEFRSGEAFNTIGKWL